MGLMWSYMMQIKAENLNALISGDDSVINLKQN